MRRLVLGLFLVSVFGVGCSSNSGVSQVVPSNSSDTATATASADAQPENPPASDSDSASASDPAPASEVALETADWATIQKWVGERRGKVVVIDVWSTYCGPCIKEFPHFVELHEKLGDKIACASLSVDFYGGAGNSPEEVRPQVLKFLTERKATMRNFLSSDSDEFVLQQIQTGSIPAALVYDTEGKLQQIFNNDKDEYGPGGFSYEKNIIPLVERLLAEKN